MTVAYVELGRSALIYKLLLEECIALIRRSYKYQITTRHVWYFSSYFCLKLADYSRILQEIWNSVEKATGGTKLERFLPKNQHR